MLMSVWNNDILDTISVEQEGDQSTNTFAVSDDGPVVGPLGRTEVMSYFYENNLSIGVSVIY